jgi:hypothetical protein
MRDQDLKRLEQPYPTEPNGTPKSDFHAALGLTLTNLRRLDAAVRGDLDFNAFGIGWWRQQNEPTLQLQQRILVSDYLIAALDGVEQNLEDLALHFLELQGAWEQDAEFIRDAFNVAHGGPPMKSPPRKRPIDDLIGARINIHMNGVFRAAGSVVDCLASVVVGVTALEENILRADWAALITRVLKNLQESQDEGRKLQLGVRDEITRLLASGATDWDQWSNDYRNMLVHRGKRTSLSWLKREAHLVDATGNPIVRAVPVQLLCTDPELSEIEAFTLQDKVLFVFNENAQVTITGLVRDVEALVEGVSQHLVSVWERRRANPQLLPQPVQRQWPKVRRRKRRSFAGYKPGETPFEMQALTVNPRYLDRLKAAAVGADLGGRVWDGVGSIDPASTTP